VDSFFGSSPTLKDGEDDFLKLKDSVSQDPGGSFAPASIFPSSRIFKGTFATDHQQG